MSSGYIKRVKILLIVVYVIAAGVFMFADGASAEIPSQLVPPECPAGQTYGLGAFVQLAVNILKLIWGILGSIAIAMFVWGGFLWLTARGDDNQVKQGWDTLINAVIGLVIVLGSWLIINTIILALTSPGSWDVAKLFSGTVQKEWTKLTAGDICVKLPEFKRGSVEAIPVNPATCTTVLQGSAFYALASGDTCQNLCFNESIKKGESLAKVMDLTDSTNTKKGCCCLFGSTAAGPGVVQTHEQGYLDKQCIAVADLSLKPTYDYVGEYTCRSADLYCDPDATRLPEQRKCFKKKEGNWICKINIECQSGKCNSGLCTSPTASGTGSAQ